MNEVQAKIVAKARRFDIVALLRLLHFLGYGEDEIQFRSDYDLTSQRSLVRAVEFIETPQRLVLITLSVGLLGPQSPLPSYFLKKLDSGRYDTVGFTDFIGYFDHLMLKAFVRNLYPESNRHVYADWEKTKAHYLHVLNLKSIATLQWLFQSVFPELRARVEKAEIDRSVTTKPARLGEVHLGSHTVLGNRASVPVHGTRVTLHCAEEMTPSGTPWPSEIKNRMQEVIAPLLGAVGTDLQLDVVLRSQRRFAQLTQGSFLGYDKIRGGGEEFRRMRLFSGHIVS